MKEEILSSQGNKGKTIVSISIALPIFAAREEYHRGTEYLH